MTTTHPKRRARSTIRVLAIATVVAAMFTVPASAQPGPSDPPPCGSSFDVYDYTPEQLSLCGIKTYPMTGISPLPGGGYAVQYQMPTGLVEELVPPSDFDPTTASDADLDRLGFPIRPTDPDQLELWLQEMSQWTSAAPPTPFLAKIPGISAGGSADPG